MMNIRFLPTGHALMLTFILACASAYCQPYYTTTVTGNGNPGFTNGPLDSATFNGPFGICTANAGLCSIFISDAGNHCIRKVKGYWSGDSVSTYAGTGSPGYLDGPAQQAKFNSPADVCADDSGNIYVADFQNHRIRKISINGMVTTVAGSGVQGYIDGPGATAQFRFPRGICRDYAGNLFVADSWNHRIRKISTDGTVSTWAGGGNAFGVGSVGSCVDGQDTAARFYTPTGLSIDWDGTIYVADAYNHRIRSISPDRQVITLAGSGPSGPGNGGYANGPATAARFNTPTGVTSGPDGIWVPDTYNNRIRKIDLWDSLVSSCAGNGSPGFLNNADTMSMFNFPRQLCYINGGPGIQWGYLVADYNNHAVRLVTWVFGMEEKEDMSLAILPNPVTNTFTIQTDDPDFQKADFVLADMLGQIILKGNSANITNIEALNPGMYLLQVISKKGKGKTVKIIKR